jgi:hypothetical protein
MNKLKLVFITGIKISFLLLSIMFFTACSDDDVDIEDVEIIDEEEGDVTIFEIGESHDEDEDYSWDSSSVVLITLNGSSITVDGEGVTVDGSKVTINKAGNYEIIGTLSDGQIQVDTEDEETVRLILNEVNITNSSSAPLYISNAEKTMIILTDNTTNYLTDSDSYIFNDGEDEPNATLFSDDDLTIYGEGTLVVNANYNDGITSKDGLIIASGTINVDAVDDGIRGKDYILVKDGDITINSDGDGLKSSNDEDINSGWIQVKSGTLNITANGDGITAESNIEITYGDFTIQSGGGEKSYLSSDDSAKGLKSTSNILIEDGVFNINSSDDTIHAGEEITINTGTFILATGDDAIHSDKVIEINGGEISITDAEEGIESPTITINDGEINIVSDDDAINAAGNTANYLYINGGYMVLNASGDGLDANGDIEMTAGTVILNGPTAQNNSPIDYDGTFKLDGGFLIASGYASNMDHAGSTSSSQNSVLVKLNSTQSAGSLFHLEDSSGNTIVTFKPVKVYKSIVFSSSDLINGDYKIYLGGSSSGTEKDGVYENGNYSSGSLYGNFTVSSVVTTVN